jgi:predicted dehydrogenase
MLGGGVHLVDLMMWMTGQTPTHVSAMGNSIASRGTRFRYDDFVTATFRFPSGMIGVISANFGSVCRHQHAVRIFGTKGMFVFDDAGARVHRERDPGGPVERLDDAPKPATKGDLIPAFLDGTRDVSAAAGDTALALGVVRACLVATAAASRGEVCPIEVS